MNIYIHREETEISTLNKVGKDITNLANINNNYQQEIRDNVVTNSDLLRYITDFL